MHQVQLKFSLLKLFRHPEDNLMRNLPETDCSATYYYYLYFASKLLLEVPTVTV